MPITIEKITYLGTISIIAESIKVGDSTAAPKIYRPIHNAVKEEAQQRQKGEEDEGQIPNARGDRESGSEGIGSGWRASAVENASSAVDQALGLDAHMFLCRRNMQPRMYSSSFRLNNY